MFYDRKIKYLDYFENGERVRGAGYVKLEARDGSLRMELAVTGLHPTDSFTRDILLCAGKIEKTIGKIEISFGRGQYRQSWNRSDNIGGTGISYKELQGVRILLGAGREISCIWQAERVVREGGLEGDTGIRAAEVVQKTENHSVLAGGRADGQGGTEIREGKTRDTKRLFPEIRRAGKNQREVSREEQGTEDQRKADREKAEQTQNVMQRQNKPVAGTESMVQSRKEPGLETESMRQEWKEPGLETESVRQEWKEPGLETESVRQEWKEPVVGTEGMVQSRKEPGPETESMRLEWKEPELEMGSVRQEWNVLNQRMENREGGQRNPAAAQKEEGRERVVSYNRQRRRNNMLMGREDGGGEASVKTDEGQSRAGRQGYAPRHAMAEEWARAGRQNRNETHGKKTVRLSEDKWSQLWEIYQHIKPFQDEREYLSIGPADFVLFSEASYKMVNNSFLLHGYYNYHHLILAKMGKKGENVYYIGVPGTFYEKEKQVAIMFGFESFECAEEPAQAGDFGYYMMRTEL